MKLIYYCGLLFFSLGTVACVEKKLDDNNDSEVCYNPNAIANDTSRVSIKSAASNKIGSASILIQYHSPKVRDRIIWGGLVPYNEVWVTGAHDATTISVDKEIEIGGVRIPAGKYAFFTIPGKESWSLIINKNWEQHLASEYQQSEDLVRINVSPETHSHTERLQYFIADKGNSEGEIRVAWEKLELVLPLKVFGN